MYSCVLFDMDGTLVDSYPGIYQAYRYAFEKMGLPFGGKAFVSRAIGAPLPHVFTRLCGLSPEKATQAIGHYRQYYDQQGKHQAAPYPGVERMLRQLRSAGRYLATATLKKEEFAREMLAEQGLLPYFHDVFGADAQGNRSKADLVRLGCAAAGASPGETVLVGDSVFDAEGAQAAGVAFLAVTYGFGFSSVEEAVQHPHVTMAAKTPEEAVERLLG